VSEVKRRESLNAVGRGGGRRVPHGLSSGSSQQD
jgi:hypothetical protein